jgi:hypothetical protein
MTSDADAVALFLQADRAYQDSRQETELLERSRADALLLRARG